MQKGLLSADSKSSKSPQLTPAISYRLSDKTFLDLGWTTKPFVSIVYPLILMRAKFSHSVISPWFRTRDEDLNMLYPDGSIVCIARKNGTGQIFYPNGKLAIVVEKGGKFNERTRVWVYSSGEVDRNGKKFSSRLCALFDSIGNGVVYDAHMRKRLVYNQREVMLYDSPVGLPQIWKWHNIIFRGSVFVMNEEDSRHHVMTDPPRQVMWVSPALQKPGKEVRRSQRSPSVSSEELTQSEYEFREAAEHSRFKDTGRCFPKTVSPIKPIVLQLNKHICLRIFSQSEITLSFFTKSHQTTLKIGVLYNPYDKLKVAEIDPSPRPERVVCAFESLPAKTESMLNFKEILKMYRTK